MKKECIACKRMLPLQDFRPERNVCKECVSLKEYNPEEFQKKYPDYPGRKRKIYGYNEKYYQKYKPPPPPANIIQCMNVLDDTLSQILTEMRQMKNLMEDILNNNK